MHLTNKCIFSHSKYCFSSIYGFKYRVHEIIAEYFFDIDVVEDLTMIKKLIFFQNLYFTPDYIYEIYFMVKHFCKTKTSSLSMLYRRGEKYIQKEV